jgi:hypothetical protein
MDPLNFSYDHNNNCIKQLRTINNYRELRDELLAIFNEHAPNFSRMEFSIDKEGGRFFFYAIKDRDGDTRHFLISNEILPRKADLVDDDVEMVGTSPQEQNRENIFEEGENQRRVNFPTNITFFPFG